MQDRHLTFGVGGRSYRQDYLPSAKALRLFHAVARLGFLPAVEVIAKAAGGQVPGGDPAALAKRLLSDPEVAGGLLATAHQTLMTATPEDVEAIYRPLAEHTWITTGDGVAEQQLSGANHFQDARDLFRYVAFIVTSCRHQLSPFFSDLLTALA